MTLSQFKRLLEISISRPDLEPLYADWINQALGTIYQDVSWNCMRTSDDFTIPAQGSSFVLPPRFKELTSGRSPVSFVASDGAETPVDLIREEDYRRRAAAFTSAALSPENLHAAPLFLQSDGDRWSLNLFDTTNTAATYRVSFYQILDPLVAETDSNYITRTYLDMVKAKIKATGFGEINDPLAETWEIKYILARKQAAADDARRSLAGRRLQMGG